GRCRGGLSTKIHMAVDGQQPRACAKARYRLRNRIERCFARLEQFRRIATGFDRKPSHFLAFLYLASIPLWVG
ncbi:MAG: transposase, partial [Comamonadaceae bacterium]|nr:transposase [Comamonadaceae bacterium]